jgi:hypothetical protein
MLATGLTVIGHLTIRHWSLFIAVVLHPFQKCMPTVKR